MADTEQNQFELSRNLDEDDIANFDNEEPIKCNEEAEISASKTALVKVVKLYYFTFTSLFFHRKFIIPLTFFFLFTS